MKKYVSQIEEASNYLSVIGFDFPELEELSSSDYKKLDILFRKRDSLIDSIQSGIIDDWMDSMSGINSIKDLKQSEMYLGKLLKNSGSLSSSEQKILQLTSDIFKILKKVR